MKNLFINQSILPLLLILGFTNCSKKETSDSISVFHHSGKTFEQLKNDSSAVLVFKKASTLGYQLDKMRLTSDSLLLVDGSDMFLTKEQVDYLYEYTARNSPEIGIRQQAITHYGMHGVVECSLDNPKSPTFNSKVQITFNIYSNVTDDWKQAIREAANQWNQTGGRITFLESNAICTGFPCNKGMPYGTPLAHVKIGMFNEPTSTVAMADLPTVNVPGKYIKINVNHNNLSSSVKLNAMVHEMGHIIGYAHTDNPTIGFHIEGTPYEDDASVMYSIVHSWLGFSTWDIIAHQTIYPNSGIGPVCKFGQ